MLGLRAQMTLERVLTSRHPVVSVGHRLSFHCEGALHEVRLCAHVSLFVYASALRLVIVPGEGRLRRSCIRESIAAVFLCLSAFHVAVNCD